MAERLEADVALKREREREYARVLNCSCVRACVRKKKRVVVVKNGRSMSSDKWEIDV